MLKKIDCVMIRVEDMQAAVTYYTDVIWPAAGLVG